MNLAAKIARVTTLPLFLSLSLFGCKTDKPNGTNPPTGGGGSADSGGGSDGGGGTADGGGGDSGSTDGGGGGETCEAKTSDSPTPLFGDKVLIRVPVNVELVEDNPTFARTFSSAGFVSACDATVKNMFVQVYENDPKKPLKTYMQEVIDVTLTQSGYANGSRAGNPVESDTDYHTIMEYPPGKGTPAVKLYVVVVRRLNNVLLVVYEAVPEEFGLLQPSFKKSAESLLIVPDE